MRSAEDNSKENLRNPGAISILYHDVTDAGDYDSSGFPGPSAGHYKLAWPDFEQHLRAIHKALTAPPVTIGELMLQPAVNRRLMLSFDDGGASSLRIADKLEEYGWKAHFFISTDYIGQPGFLNAAQISELYQRGHVVGSHSCSHPRRMSACSWEQLIFEWKQSADTLSQTIGEPISIASVPGGNYSRKVAEAAAQAGMKVLFTSEPTTRTATIAGCLVLGRYGVVRGMSPTQAADIAAARWIPRAQQQIAWKTKMALKSIAGGYYDRFRNLRFGEDGDVLQSATARQSVESFARAERKGQQS